jgi:hypothetical protein
MNKRLLLKNKNMKYVFRNIKKVVVVVVHQLKEVKQHQKLHQAKNHQKNQQEKKHQLKRNHLKKIMMTMMMMKMMKIKYFGVEL